MIEMMLQDTTIEQFSDWMEYFTMPSAIDDIETFQSSLGVILLWPARIVEDKGSVFLTLGGYFKKGRSYNYYEKYFYKEALKAEIELRTTQRMSKFRRNSLLAESRRPAMSYEYLPDLIKFELTQLADGQLEIHADCQDVVTSYFEKLLQEIALRWPEVKDLVENYNFARMLKRSGVIDVDYRDLITLEEDDETGRSIGEYTIGNRHKSLPVVTSTADTNNINDNKAGQPTIPASLAYFVPEQRLQIDEACKRWAGRGYLPKMDMSEFLHEFENQTQIYLSDDQFKDALKDAGRREVIVKINSRWRLPKTLT